MNANEVIKDGYKRIVHKDSVDWYIQRRGAFDYCVSRFPFVPDYHLCQFVGYEDPARLELPTEYPLQTFKTLTEALAVLRVLDASSPEARDG